MNQVIPNIKQNTEELNANEKTAAPRPKTKAKFISITDSTFFMDKEAARKWLPFVLFLFGIAVFYISYQHYAESTVRKTEKTMKSIKELRSEYLTTKAEVMKQSMQSEVARRLEETGIKELREPPKKIIVTQEN